MEPPPLRRQNAFLSDATWPDATADDVYKALAQVTPSATPDDVYKALAQVTPSAAQTTVLPAQASSAASRFGSTTVSPIA